MTSTSKDLGHKIQPKPPSDQNDSAARREQGQPGRAPSTPSQEGPTGRPERPIADVDRKVRGGDA